MDQETQIEQTPEELEIASAFAEFAAEPSPAAKTKTPEEIAAEAAAAASAASAKTPEEIAAEAAAAEAAKAKTPEEIAAETAAAAKAKTPEEIAAETAAAEAAAAEAQAAATAAEAAKAKPVEDPRIAELMAEVERIKAAQPKAEDKPVELYTPEEKSAMAKYEEDWPDISKAEELKRRSEYSQIVSHIFKEVARVYGPALEYTQDRGVHDQYTDIKGLVPDYDIVRDKTLEWVDRQPAWLKSAYTKVASEGTPEEVAGLIGLFKKETGYVAPVNTETDAAKAAAATAAAKTAAATAAATAAPALSPAAKQAAAKLTVVKTGRTEAGTAAEETFENSFAGYAAEEEKRLSRK
jgi:hypothetical protein